jgi:hypothetical protein
MLRKSTLSDVDEVVMDVVIAVLVVEVEAAVVTDTLVVVWCSAYCFEVTE